MTDAVALGCPVIRSASPEIFQSAKAAPLINKSAPAAATRMKFLQLFLQIKFLHGSGHNRDDLYPHAIAVDMVGR